MNQNISTLTILAEFIADWSELLEQASAWLAALTGRILISFSSPKTLWRQTENWKSAKKIIKNEVIVDSKATVFIFLWQVFKDLNIPNLMRQYLAESQAATGLIF